MKIIIGIILCMPFVAWAQDMEAMMKQMQEMQACMEKVDQSELASFGEKGQKLEANVKALCASGDRGRAQDEVIAFSKTVADSKALKQMNKCLEMIKGAMAGMMPEKQAMPFSEFDESDYADMHVCDADSFKAK